MEAESSVETTSDLSISMVLDCDRGVLDLIISRPVPVSIN